MTMARRTIAIAALFVSLAREGAALRTRRAPSMAFGPVRVRTVSDLTEGITDTFVKGFWGEGLSDAQLKRLGNDVTRDLSVRYCSEDVGDKRSALLALSKGSGASEEFLGFAGLEIVPDLRKYLGLSQFDFNEKVLGQSEGEWDPSEATMPGVVLGNLVVTQSTRGRGHAQHLIRSCEALARSWGQGELWLSVEENNSRAISVYRKKGFVPVCNRQSMAIKANEIQIKTVKVREICMRKPIAGALAPIAEGAPALFYTMRNLV